MVKAKPNQKIHVNQLTTALDKLDQLESKPKEELTLRESIYFLRGKLNSALKKGYSYQDLSEVLEEQKILISAATLKQYLTDMSKNKSSSRKKKSKSVSSSGTKSGNEFSGQPDTQISTNVTDSKEELAPSNSQAEINRMKKSDEIASIGSTSIKTKAKSKSKSPTKPKVLSGLSDDLSGDFNS